MREFGTIYEGLLENELLLAVVDLATELVKNEERYRPAKKVEEGQVPKGQVYLHTWSGA